MWGLHPPRFRCPNRLSHLGRLPAHFGGTSMSGGDSRTWTYIERPCSKGTWTLALRIVASTLPFSHIAISQPCIYIISYLVEFVKRFYTLFLFFLCGFKFYVFDRTIFVNRKTFQNFPRPNPLGFGTIAFATAFLLTRCLPPSLSLCNTLSRWVSKR